MRVLVTGGAGFIGSHVVAQALAAGLEVAVLDDFSSGKREHVPPGVPVFQVDLRQRDATLRAVRDFGPQLVSHQAAQISISRSATDPIHDTEVNVIGGLNLLDACTARGSRVQRIVFASTAAVYSELLEGESAAETFRPEPNSPYGISKLTFERWLQVYQERHGLQGNVLRYSNVYGPRQDPHGETGVVARFFHAVRAGEPLRIHGRRRAGDGGCARDYVFVEDVAQANLLALRGKLTDAVTNVATGRATTTRELARQISSVCGVPSYQVVEAPPRGGDVERSVLDPARLERVLGPARSLDDGLRETARWYRAH